MSKKPKLRLPDPVNVSALAAAALGGQTTTPEKAVKTAATAENRIGTEAGKHPRVVRLDDTELTAIEELRDRLATETGMGKRVTWIAAVRWAVLHARDHLREKQQ